MTDIYCPIHELWSTVPNTDEFGCPACELDDADRLNDPTWADRQNAADLL